jgi:hypothetical protein
VQLLPKDEKFYDLITNQAKIAREASAALLDGLKNNNGASGASEMAKSIRALEQKGDELFHTLNLRLHKTFITPVDPEDIHQLASLLDNVIDLLDSIAYRIDAFRLDNSSGTMREIAGLIHRCVEAVFAAMETLEQEGVKKPEKLSRNCEEINRLESEAENRIREVIRDLLANERDPITLIKQKEIYELLESAGDACENVADMLEAIAVKNS